MKPPLRRPRILVLALVCVSVAGPLVLLSVLPTDLSPSIAHREFIGETPGIVKNLSPKNSADVLKLNSIEQEDGEGLKEPTRFVFKDGGKGGSATIEDVTAPGSRDVNAQGGEVRDRNALVSADRKVIDS